MVNKFNLKNVLKQLIQGSALALVWSYMLVFTTISLAQKNNSTYAKCEGTINIFRSNNFELQFLGEKENSTVFNEYSALQHIKSGNQIWFNFIAPTNGNLSLNLSSMGNKNLKLIAFDALVGNVCKNITTGNAEILRVVEPIDGKKIGLNKNVTAAYLYPISLLAGSAVQFVVVTDSLSTDFMSLQVNFEAENTGQPDFQKKEVDFRFNKALPSLTIEVKDKDTGFSLISNLIVSGLQKMDGMYTVSNLVFDISKRFKLILSSDLEGYFPIDQNTYYISGESNVRIVIEMEPIKKGRSIQLSNVEFVPGTSEVTESSIPKLIRIKDFLALNASIHVEIQGHVFEPAIENSFSGQKMSEARAKRIMKYLVDYGIAKERLTAVGYGNQVPVYRYPKNASEEQVNRRVEILVK